jgi:2'-5' RNA ligase
MPLESLLGIQVPEAEALVNLWHQRHNERDVFDVPAHITLLYPFVPSTHITSTLLEELHLFFSTISSFRVTLARLGYFPNTHVFYLAPEPTEPLRVLIELLTDRYPDILPYGGAFEKVIPHLTIAHNADSEMRQQITETFHHFEPIEIQITETCLMVQIENQRWQIRTRFPLAR